MKNYILVLVICVLATSCREKEEPGEYMIMMKKAPNVLCGSGEGEGYLASQETLVENGITVFNSWCAYIVDQDGLADCKYFDRVNVHSIYRSNQTDAEDLGYFPIYELEEIYGLKVRDEECNWAN